MTSADTFSPLYWMQSRVRQFMDLPPELRLMVWKFVLRPLDPDRPGAHFFSVANNRQNGYKAAMVSTQCGRCGNWVCSHYHLAAPKLDSSEYSHSWTKKNPSAYVWDFGMWNACRESRQVIEAHYRTAGWTEKLRGGSSSRSYRNTSVVLKFLGNNEEWRFIIHPEQDLVCLQAFHPNTIPWGDDGQNDICFADGASRLFNTLRSGINPRIYNFHNIAIAYDPSWNDIRERMEKYSFRCLYEEQSARGFFIRTLVMIEQYNSRYRRCRKSSAFWLIDYNLKRVRYLDKNRKGRKVFYGNGQIFTEFDKSLSRRSFSSGGYSSALDFLDNLDILLEGRKPSHGMLHNRDQTSCSICPSHNAMPYQIHRRVGVLMCEKST